MGWAPETHLCSSVLQFRYKEAFLRDRGLQIGLRSVHDDPRMRHFLRVGRLQSDNEYKKGFAESRSQFHSRPDQPGFLQAKRSQQLASDVRYRQPLPQPTCDPEQLGLKHAQRAHQLQSDVSRLTRLAQARPRCLFQSDGRQPTSMLPVGGARLR